jgi:signal transduction histidine kinase
MQHRQLVREAVSEQRHQHEQRSIRLEVPDAPITVLADADRIGQVVTQYVSNALKYAPEDRAITVVLEVRDEQARVGVHDEGPSLPPDEQEQVWEAFYRAPGVEVPAGPTLGWAWACISAGPLLSGTGARGGSRAQWARALPSGSRCR